MPFITEVHGVQLTHHAFFAIQQVVLLFIQFNKLCPEPVERNRHYFTVSKSEGFDLFFFRVADINNNVVFFRGLKHLHLFTGQVIGNDVRDGNLTTIGNGCVQYGEIKAGFFGCNFSGLARVVGFLR